MLGIQVVTGMTLLLDPPGGEFNKVCMYVTYESIHLCVCGGVCVCVYVLMSPTLDSITGPNSVIDIVIKHILELRLKVLT